MAQDVEILEGPGAEARLVDALIARGAVRVMLVGSAGRPAGVERLARALGERVATTCWVTEPQVPGHVADAAAAQAEAHAVDWVVAHGGGTPMGVAKAIALQHPVQLAAVPTTYAGSERTGIWGVTRDGVKTTGRDDRVRPSLVAYDPALTASLPPALAIESLYNALAHSVEALYAAQATDAAQAAARDSLAPLARAIRDLIRDPADPDARADASRGAGLAGAALDGASMALQHKLAHVVASGAGTPHAATHAALLAFTLAFNADAPTLAPLRAAFGVHDVAGLLFDLAGTAGLDRSLRALGVQYADLDALADEAGQRAYANPKPLDRALIRGVLEDAWLGRRPGASQRGEAFSATGPHAALRPAISGVALDEAHAAVLVIHGRGGSAESETARLRRAVGGTPGLAWLAPQAALSSWYPKAFDAGADNAEHLASALAVLDAAWARLTAVIDPDRIVVAGFSQGACLALAWLTSRGHAPARTLAFSGACPPIDAVDALAGQVVYLSRSAGDAWIPEAAFAETARALTALGAQVTTHTAPGDAHRLHPADGYALRDAIDHVLRERPIPALHGFGNQLASSAEPGALPVGQNSPKAAPYGLFAEQINGTGFTVERALNRNVWLYRLRPPIATTAWRRLPASRFTGRFDAGVPTPQIMRYRAPNVPTAPTDWLDGLTTFAGAGDPARRQGMAVHLYAANRSMQRAFCNIDGDLVVTPVTGRLRIRTEMGWLSVGPAEVAILPRGVRFQVCLLDAAATGYVAEVFDGHVVLPERGLLGANGLAASRHFRAPKADYENRVGPYPVVVKQGGDLWAVELNASPFDVVAWHGNYTPVAYDLRLFNSVGSVSFDHPDPSIMTVLTCPMDAHGRNALDVAVFKGRWDVTEGTFRPPYFHRNSAIEFNGVVLSDATDGPWQRGAFSYTPYLTPHGVSATGHRRGVRGPEAPTRLPDASLWVQFESTYPLKLMPWMLDDSARDP
ncbi:MAG: homogentisate 1,2-dioxygenase, partial [Bradymonadia bacterium]